MSGESDQTKGRVKGASGVLTGDKKLETSGKHDQLAGQAKNKVSRAEEKVEHGIDKAKEAFESALDKAKDVLHHR